MSTGAESVRGSLGRRPAAGPRRVILAAVLAGAVALAAAGCEDQGSLDLDPAAQTWLTYVDGTVGYSLSHPEAFRASPEENGNTLFRFSGGGVPALVRYTTEAKGRRNGAWFGHPPVEEITLDGVPGKKYVYDHWDLIFSTRTVAFVVPLEDRWLGLEFRTPGELSPVQQRMLESFRLP